MSWPWTGVLARKLDDPQLRRLGELMLLCSLIGLIAGLGAVGFYTLLEASRAIGLGYLANFFPVTPGHEHALFHWGSWADGGIVRWMLLLVPALGGLISGVIVFTLAPEAEGHGTDAAIEAYHFKDGYVRPRVPFIKAITAAITIGTGGSAGREGPIAQIGSGFGSMLARRLKVRPHERRIFMAAGMAAGIGAIFHAPLAGALVAAEIMYRGPDFEHEVIVPAFIASIVAYSVFGWTFGFHPLFDTPEYAFTNPVSLLPYMVLTLVVSGGAFLYVKAFYGFRRFMFDARHWPARRRIPNHFKPAIGGLLVGLVGFFLPEALGTGYGIIQMCFNRDAGAMPGFDASPSAGWVGAMLPAATSPALIAAALMTVVALAKIATTAFTVGSGGSGGVFGPAVAIGGALGGATGLICQQLFPSLPIHPGALALVGMAGFFAGAAHTPVSTIIMVSEMTGNYSLLVPAMLVCIGAFVCCQRFTLYEKQLPSRLDAPSKMGNMASAILRRVTVKQALSATRQEPLIAVPRHASLTALTEQFVRSHQDIFPVVDEEGRLTGMIDADILRRVVNETGMGSLINAFDLEQPAVTITADDSLLTAVNQLVTHNVNELVVVDAARRDQAVATLRRGDIIASYYREILAGSPAAL